MERELFAAVGCPDVVMAKPFPFLAWVVTDEFVSRDKGWSQDRPVEKGKLRSYGTITIIVGSHTISHVADS